MERLDASGILLRLGDTFARHAVETLSTTALVGVAETALGIRGRLARRSAEEVRAYLRRGERPRALFEALCAPEHAAVAGALLNAWCVGHVVLPTGGPTAGAEAHEHWQERFLALPEADRARAAHDLVRAHGANAALALLWADSTAAAPLLPADLRAELAAALEAGDAPWRRAVPTEPDPPRPRQWTPAEEARAGLAQALQSALDACGADVSVRGAEVRDELLRAYDAALRAEEELAAEVRGAWQTLLGVAGDAPADAPAAGDPRWSGGPRALVSLWDEIARHAGGAGVRRLESLRATFGELVRLRVPGAAAGLARMETVDGAGLRRGDPTAVAAAEGAEAELAWGRDVLLLLAEKAATGRLDLSRAAPHSARSVELAHYLLEVAAGERRLDDRDSETAPPSTAVTVAPPPDERRSDEREPVRTGSVRTGSVPTGSAPTEPQPASDPTATEPASSADAASPPADEDAGEAAGPPLPTQEPAPASAAPALVVGDEPQGGAPPLPAAEPQHVASQLVSTLSVEPPLAPHRNVAEWLARFQPPNARGKGRRAGATGDVPLLPAEEMEDWVEDLGRHEWSDACRLVEAALAVLPADTAEEPRRRRMLATLWRHVPDGAADHERILGELALAAWRLCDVCGALCLSLPLAQRPAGLPAPRVLAALARDGERRTRWLAECSADADLGSIDRLWLSVLAATEFARNHDFDLVRPMGAVQANEAPQLHRLLEALAGGVTAVEFADETDAAAAHESATRALVEMLRTLLVSQGGYKTRGGRAIFHEIQTWAGAVVRWHDDRDDGPPGAETFPEACLLAWVHDDDSAAAVQALLDRTRAAGKHDMDELKGGDAAQSRNWFDRVAPLVRDFLDTRGRAQGATTKPRVAPGAVVRSKLDAELATLEAAGPVAARSVRAFRTALDGLRGTT